MKRNNPNGSKVAGSPRIDADTAGGATAPSLYVDSTGRGWTRAYINERANCPTANGRDLDAWGRFKERFGKVGA